MSSKTQYCIERLCSEGCRAVYGYIKKLENGENVPHTENFSEAEKQHVLAELKSIMDVYEKGSDSCNS